MEVPGRILKGLLAVTLGCAGGLPASAEEKPIVAVFDAEPLGMTLPLDLAGRLSLLMATRLAETETFQIVPRAQLRQALEEQKKTSHKACFDQSCQIEVGRELAAEKAVSIQILKLGARCTVTASVFDLRKATTSLAASADGPCHEEGLAAALDKVVAKLSAKSLQPTRPVPSEPPEASPPPEAPPPPEPASPAAGPPTPAEGYNSRHLALAAREIPPTMEVVATWRNTPGNRDDWITVVPAGTPDDRFGKWMYLEGKTSGSFGIGALDPGNYEVRLYFRWAKDGFVVRDRIGFQVTPLKAADAQETKHLFLPERHFAAGTMVTIRWLNTPGNAKDWITVVPVGTPEDKWGQWMYLDSLTSGSYQVQDLEPGEYETRLYFNWPDGGLIVRDRLTFTVR